MSNDLIKRLPRADARRIAEHCTVVDLKAGAVLCEQDQPLRQVYLPLTCFISLLASVRDHPPLEMGLIGSEGMLGATLALGISTAPLTAKVQGDGKALTMSTVQLLREMRASPALVRTLQRYLYVLMAQLSQTTVCSRFHEVEERLARWLLMTHDRAHADHFHLTHQSLADMLGVRRSGVTIAAGALQSRDLIEYSRGEINILDRKGLEAVSCECYDAVVADYVRTLSRKARA